MLCRSTEGKGPESGKGVSTSERDHRAYLVKHDHETDINTVNRFQVINKDFKSGNESANFFTAFSTHSNLCTIQMF